MISVILAVIGSMIVLPVIGIVVFIVRRTLNFFRFHSLQKMKNKNGKSLKHAPYYYGLGVGYDWSNMSTLLNTLLNYSTSDLNDEGIFETLMLGIPQISVSDPAMLKQITVNSNPKYPKNKHTYDMLKPVLGLGLVTSEGSLWSRQRRLISPLFSEKSIQLMTTKMTENTIREKDRIVKLHGSDPAGFDFGDFASRLTLRIIAACAFGLDKDVRSEQLLDTMAEKWVQVFDRFGHFQVFAGYLLFGSGYKRFRVGSNRSFISDLEEIKQSIVQIIEDKRKKLETQEVSDEAYSDLLTVLISARDENGDALSEEQIIDESHTFLFAGHETTSSLVSWMFYLFCIHKDVQEKVCKDVDQFFQQHDTVTFENVQNIKYLQQVIQETLRFYPPVTNVDRETNQDMYLGDYFLPKGTELTLNILGLHRNEKYWKNANVFDPDRWSEERLKTELTQPLNNVFMPFSRGARDCIGRRFATVEAAIITAILLREYTVSFADGVSPSTVGSDMSSILKPKFFRAVLTERKPL